MTHPEPATPDAPRPGLLVAPLRRAPGAKAPIAARPTQAPLNGSHVAPARRAAVPPTVDVGLAHRPNTERHGRGRWVACLALAAFVVALGAAVALSLPAHHAARAPALPVAPTPPIAPVTVPPISKAAARPRLLMPIHVGPGHRLLSIATSAAGAAPTVALVDPSGHVSTAAKPAANVLFGTQPQFHLTEITVMNPAAGVWHVRTAAVVQIHKQLDAVPTRATTKHRHAARRAATPRRAASRPAATPAPAQTAATVYVPRVVAPVAPLRPEPRVPTTPHRTPCVPGSLGC